jgi:uncharacterized membrane protein YqjE
MNRHPFRWEGLAFGLFFLAVLGQWAVWEQDWLDPEDLGYLAAATLILLGVLGIVATVGNSRRPQEAPHTPEKTTEEGPTHEHEEA